MVQYSNIGNRLTGQYRGMVLKHCDNGKCKVFIPSVYSDDFMFDPMLLPDAEQAVSLSDAGINGQSTTTYPPIGSIVWCTFLNGDQNYPIMQSAVLAGGTQNSQFDNDEVLGHFELPNKTDELDYASSKPLVWKRCGRSNEMTTRDGTTLKGIQRNQFNAEYDLPRSEYSHTMHTVNYLRDEMSEFKNAKAYFVYTTTDKLEDTTVDTLYVREAKHFTNTNENDSDWFTDLRQYDSGTCIGVLFKLKKPQSDEDAFVTSVNSKLIQHEKSNSRGLYHNYQRPVYSPRATGANSSSCEIYEQQAAAAEGSKLETVANAFCPLMVSCPKFEMLQCPLQKPPTGKTALQRVFICTENNYKWSRLFETAPLLKKINEESEKKNPDYEKIKTLKLLLVDLYICNGAQYDFIPEYWDKHFAGSYSAMCPKFVIPPPVLADVASYDLNIILIDPILVESYDVKLNDGKQISYLLDHETEFEQRTTVQNGCTTVSRFKQMCDDYSAVQSEIKEYHSSERVEDFDSLSCKEVIKKHEHAAALMLDLTCSTEQTTEKSEKTFNALTSTWLPVDANVREDYVVDDIKLDSGPKVNEYLVTHADKYLNGEVMISSEVSHTIYASDIPTNKIRQTDIQQSFYGDGYHYGEIVRLEAGIETEYVKSNADQNGNLSVHSTATHEDTVNNPLSDPNNWCYRISQSDGTEDVEVTTKKTLTVQNPTDSANQSFCSLDKSGNIGVIATNQVTADVGNGNYTLKIDNAGNVLINAASQIKFVVGSSTVEINSSGVVNITADVNITGKLHVTSDQTNDANITATGTIKDAGCTLATHTHLYAPGTGALTPTKTGTG